MSAGGVTATRAPVFPFFRLLVIAGAIFASVTSEFLPTGLLPEIAADLRVTEAQVGLLITVFAGTVVVSTAPLALLTRNVSRKWLMVGLLSGFAVTNLLCAIAPEYWVLAVARVLGGLSHGLFWAVTGPYASRLVTRSQLARAIAVTNAGGTAAFVAGVPLGTALGHALGWRMAFGVMGAVVVVFVALVVFFLPPVQHIEPLATGEIAIPTRRDPTVPAVLAVCVTVILVATGQNVFYTYIAPWITQVAHFDPDAVSPLLFAYGAAGAVGLVLAGFAGDRYPIQTPRAMVIGVAAGVILVSLGSAVPALVIVGLIIWSISFGGFPASMHATMLRSASSRVRDQASAWLTTSFNIAIGGGALIGAAVLSGWGLAVVPWVMIGFLVVGLAFQIGVGTRPNPDRGASSAT